MEINMCRGGVAIEFGIIKAKMWQYGAFLVQELCEIWSVSRRDKIIQY